MAKETFKQIFDRMSAQKSEIQKKHTALLNDRYDLSNKPSKTVKMFKGKPIQEGVRAKLPSGIIWERLSMMTPEEIKTKNLFPKGLLPLPHPNHPEGACFSLSII